MKNKYDKEKLRKYFNKIDPMGIYFDENKDEYDPEINALIESSVDLKKLQEVEIELMEIFQKFFEGMEIDRNLINKLAKKISSI